MTLVQEKPLIVLNALHTESGGGAVYLQNILVELAKDDRFAWRVVMTPKGVGLVTIPDGVDVHILPRFRFGVSHLVEQVWLPILAYKWRARIVWSNANYGPLFAPNAMVTLHTTPRAAAVWPGLYWKTYWFVWWWLTWVCLMRAPRFFAVAEHVIADFSVSFLPPYFHRSGISGLGKKGRVAYPAAKTIEFKGQKLPKQVVAVGDFYRHKRYDVLISAFALVAKEVPEATLLLIGRPQFDGVYEDSMALVKAFKLDDKVTIIPGLPHEQTLRRVAESGCYVSSSAAECFNMPVLEAMTLGVPVVLPDVAFQREVAGDAALYVPRDEGDIAGLAAAMALVLTDDELAKKLAQQGRLRAEKFSWKASADVMREVFADVVFS